MCPLGIVNPVDLNADLRRPSDSLIDESQSPITENVGIPGEIETSTRETVASEPETKLEYSLVTLGFEVMVISSFYKENTPFKIRLSGQKTCKKPTRNPARFTTKTDNRDELLRKPTKEHTNTRQKPTKNLQSISIRMC